MDRVRMPWFGRRALAALGAGGAALLLAPALSGAATITPSPGFLGDDFTNNGNCSLREAIEVANDDAAGGPEDSCIVVGALGDDTVDLGVGIYRLTLHSPIEENDFPNPQTNASDDLDVSTTGGSLTIEGAGARGTTIRANRQDRVLEHEGTNLLTVRGVTVTGGSIAPEGAGIDSEGALTIDSVRVTGNDASFMGGGVRGANPLTIKDSLIDGNTVGSGNPNFTDSMGGGVAAFGRPITISSSVIRDNAAYAVGGGPVPTVGSATGGGLWLRTFGTARVSGSVIADNEAFADIGAATGGVDLSMAFGGSAASVTLSGSTVSGNTGGVWATGDADDTLNVVNSTVTANDGFGLVSSDLTSNVIHATLGPTEGPSPTALHQGPTGTLNVRGSVVDAACEGQISSQGGNVVRTAPCLTGGPGNDQEGVDPQLAPLAPKGGVAGPPGFEEPILTHRPALSSPAVDRVPAGDCLDELLAPLVLDQRGLPRPVDGDGDSIPECESGSYELQMGLPVPGPPPVTGHPPATSPPPTRSDQDRSCDRLRKKLRRAKKKGKTKQAKKLRRKLRRRDC